MYLFTYIYETSYGNWFMEGQKCLNGKLSASWRNSKVNDRIQVMSKVPRPGALVTEGRRWLSQLKAEKEFVHLQLFCSL